MDGGSGDDLFFVTSSQDIVIGGDGIDIVRASVSFVLTSTDVEIVSLYAATGHLRGVGNDGDERIVSANVCTLSGKGGDDELAGSEGDDVLHGDGGDDELWGNWGDDELLGGTGDEVLHGRLGNDMLSGGGGNDILQAGAGDDTLNGGRGIDMLSGNGGRDTFLFGTPLVARSLATITDLTAGVDTVALARSVFAEAGPLGVLAADAFHIGAGAHDATDRIIYDAANGDLAYDADGIDGLAAVTFAHVSTALSLSASMFRIV